MLRLILNTLSFIAVLIVNYASATGLWFENNVGEISDKYDTLFTPAGYAFSIWSVIYIFLLAFVGYQWYAYFKENNKKYIEDIGLWFISANVANSLWIISWLQEDLAMSVTLMNLLLLSLVQLVIRLKLEVWDAPLKIIAFVWWPITLYLGWIIVADVANIASFLIYLGWEPGLVGEVIITILMIGVATVIYLMLLKKRNMREACLVGIWALIAISVRHWGQWGSIAYSALAAAIILAVASGRHAYKNRATLPHTKL